jgi:NAD(P)-dependent dehydrogenase (short-subunit alcohol dehydrogenase family)
MAHVLITGANRGIGLALTRACLARGDTVTAACRDPGSASGLKVLATAHPGRLAIVALDVTSGESVAAAAKAVSGPVDVLINNAGIYGPRDRQGAFETDFAAWAQVLDVNTLGPLRVTQAFLPHLEQARGKVCTVTSRMGSLAGDNSGAIAYRSSKAAVNKAMLVMAAALKPKGIAVLLIHPGWVKTDMGGTGADIAPDVSAEGILKRIEALTLERSGAFEDHSGAPIAW